MTCPRYEELLDHADGELGQDQRALISAHLRRCAPCRGVVEDLHRVVDTLSERAPHYQSEARRAAIRGAVRALGQEPEPGLWRWLTGAQLRWSAAVATVAVVVIAVWWLAPQDDSQFQSRTASSGAMNPLSWSGIRLFHVDPGSGRAELVDGSFRADDELLVSYTNLEPVSFGYLAVVARDAAGDVHWLQPAPGVTALPIQVGANLEIKEAVRTPFAPGRLLLAACFSHAPLAAPQVEAWMQRASVQGGAAQLPGATTQLLSLIVQPASEPQP